MDEMTYNVHCRVGRHVTHAGENKRSVEFPDWRLWKGASESVDDKGKEETDNPKVLKLAVDGNAGEHVLGTNGTPNDRGIVKRFDVITSEVVGSISRADVRNSTHGPLDN